MWNTSAEEIIEIAKSVFKGGKLLEKIISIGIEFEPQELADIGDDVTDLWIVVFELDIPIDPGFAVVYVHDKTHETTIMPTM